MRNINLSSKHGPDLEDREGLTLHFDELGHVELNEIGADIKLEGPVTLRFIDVEQTPERREVWSQRFGLDAMRAGLDEDQIKYYQTEKTKLFLQKHYLACLLKTLRSIDYFEIDETFVKEKELKLKRIDEQLEELENQKSAWRWEYLGKQTSEPDFRQSDLGYLTQVALQKKRFPLAYDCPTV